MTLRFRQKSVELFQALFFFRDFTMDIFTKVAKSFESQTFMKTIGAKLDSVDEGRVVISVELKSSMMQQHGFGHAGVTFSIGDSAAGYAALTKMGKNHVLTNRQAP